MKLQFDRQMHSHAHGTRMVWHRSYAYRLGASHLEKGPLFRSRERAAGSLKSLRSSLEPIQKTPTILCFLILAGKMARKTGGNRILDEVTGQARVRPTDKQDEACTNADDRMMLVRHRSGS